MSQSTSAFETASNITDVTLRFLVPEDIEQVKELCQDWFPIQYPSFWYECITETTQYYALAATLQDTIVALLVAQTKPVCDLNEEDRQIMQYSRLHGGNIGYILTLGVQKQHRRQGLASLLLTQYLEHLRLDCDHKYREHRLQCLKEKRGSGVSSRRKRSKVSELSLQSEEALGSECRGEPATTLDLSVLDSKTENYFEKTKSNGSSVEYNYELNCSKSEMDKTDALQDTLNNCSGESDISITFEEDLQCETIDLERNSNDEYTSVCSPDKLQCTDNVQIKNSSVNSTNATVALSSTLTSSYVVETRLLCSAVLQRLQCSESCFAPAPVTAVVLHVLTTNIPAIRFYSSRHFVRQAFLPLFYYINDERHDGFSYVLYINGGLPPASAFPLPGSLLRLTQEMSSLTQPLSQLTQPMSRVGQWLLSGVESSGGFLSLLVGGVVGVFGRLVGSVVGTALHRT